MTKLGARQEKNDVWADGAISLVVPGSSVRCPPCCCWARQPLLPHVAVQAPPAQPSMRRTLPVIAGYHSSGNGSKCAATRPVREIAPTYRRPDPHRGDYDRKPTAAQWLLWHTCPRPRRPGPRRADLSSRSLGGHHGVTNASRIRGPKSRKSQNRMDRCTNSSQRSAAQSPFPGRIHLTPNVTFRIGSSLGGFQYRLAPLPASDDCSP